MSRAGRFLDVCQLGLPLPHQPALGREDFIVSSCNAAAARLIDDWPHWQFGRAAVIIGPNGAGKSHLARAFARRAGATVAAAHVLVASASLAFGDAAPARVVEDVDRGVDEPALLHLFNATLEAGGFVLMTACTPPARWPLALPDLVSRLRVLQVAEIGAPDDAILPALIGKLFADRQLAVGAEAIAFMLPRIERSYAALHTLVEALDRAALSGARAVTVPLVRAVLAGDATPYDEAMKS